MPDFMKILQQAQELQGRMQKIQEELTALTVTGSAGGGLVTAEVNGQGQIKRIQLDPSVVKPDDIEMLEDLIVVAVSEAQKKAQDEAQNRMGELTGGLGGALGGLGGLGGKLPFKLPF